MSSLCHTGRDGSEYCTSTALSPCLDLGARLGVTDASALGCPHDANQEVTRIEDLPAGEPQLVLAQLPCLCSSSPPAAGVVQAGGVRHQSPIGDPIPG